MQTLILFEDAGYRNLLPLTYMRPCWALRVGYGCLCDHLIANIRHDECVFYTRPALADVTAERTDAPVHAIPVTEQAWLVNGRLLLTGPLPDGPCPAVQWVGDTPAIIQADRTLLLRLEPEVLQDPAALRRLLADVPEHAFLDRPRLMDYPWDLIHANVDVMEYDWKRLAPKSADTARTEAGVHILNKSAVHIGKDAVLKPGAVIDAEAGAVYIADGAVVSSHVTVQGPCYIGERTLIQPGASIREGTSIGPRCKIGGEIEGSIIHGFSNKQHDGFLGHAYVGEWVNLAADTVNSDLKNTYGNVRVPINGVEVDSGHMFFGLTIGDHAKTGIGQLFATGAVVGFGSNVATGGLGPKFVPSFTWLTAAGSASYDVTRCVDVARRVMARRQITLTAAQEKRFHAIAREAPELEAPER